jgi:hypothetical protein
MQHKRTVQRSLSFADSPDTANFVRQSFGNIRVSFDNQQKNTIQVRIIVSFDTQGWEAEWDGFTIKTELKTHLRRFLAQILGELFPKWQFGGIDIEIKRF